MSVEGIKGGHQEDKEELEQAAAENLACRREGGREGGRNQ